MICSSDQKSGTVSRPFKLPIDLTAVILVHRSVAKFSIGASILEHKPFHSSIDSILVTELKSTADASMPTDTLAARRSD